MNMICLLNTTARILAWAAKNWPPHQRDHGLRNHWRAPQLHLCAGLCVAGGSLGLMHARKITKVMISSHRYQ